MLEQSDILDVSALLTEMETLREENRRMTVKVRKAERALSDEQLRLQRIQDANEAKRQFLEVVQAERSHLERNMNLLLQNSRDLILFFDADEKLAFATDSLIAAVGVAGFGLLATRTFREVFAGLLDEEVIAQIEDFMATSARAAQTDATRARTCGLELQIRADLYDFEGERDYRVDASLMINEAGEKQGWLIFIYDTTDLMQAKREADQANAAKSDFLATISHEIRTPMNAIIGLAKMLGVTDLDEHQSELLSKIEASSNVMLSLINDILDFSKIEAGKLELIYEYFDLHELLASLVSLFELMLSQKSLKLNTSFAEDLPHIVYADPKRIRQVITNIVNNAYKYTQSGEVDFSVRRLDANDGATWLRFEVTDTGIGIREEELGRLFVAFEQLDVVRNKHIVGTGLGLAITRSLTEMMGGRVKVHSVYGEGSTFTIEIPLTEGSLSDMPKASKSSTRFTAPDARILVVDDVEVNLEIAEFMLEPFQMTVVRALDGQEALEKVSEEHFDLILMDHMMPRMDGVEATMCIRQLPGPMAQVPIVALTANAISGVQQMFAEAGFTGFISKPIDADTLASILYEQLPGELICEE
ncbi:MAG: response regulator [Coriobacteriales bacterium]|jgi:signal transduction histidine kinase/ActR/RegA family two-component response regulator|nr:response regulator [Coriobacteriales bacterium]